MSSSRRQGKNACKVPVEYRVIHDGPGGPVPSIKTLTKPRKRWSPLPLPRTRLKGPAQSVALSSAMSRARKKSKRKADDPPNATFNVPKQSALRNVKCKLRTIVRDPAVEERLLTTAKLCHDIVTEAYLFIRLYLLHLFEHDVALPKVDKAFVMLVFDCLCVQRHKATKPPTTHLEQRETLKMFFEDFYRPLRPQGAQLYEVEYMSQVLSYQATQIEVAHANNIKVHFVTRLIGFVNHTAKDYEQDCEDQATAREQRKLLKEALFTNNASLVPERYEEWWATYRHWILPLSWPVDKPLSYHVKSDPSAFLIYTMRMDQILESLGKEKIRLFQPLPIRTTSVPCYITIDTEILVKMLVNEAGLPITSTDGKVQILKKSYLRRGHISEYQEQIWRAFFQTERTRYFGRNNYGFNYMIQTDGVGVSIVQRHKDYPKTKKCGPPHPPPPHLAGSVEDKLDLVKLTDVKEDDLQGFQKCNIVGLDPGRATYSSW